MGEFVLNFLRETPSREQKLVIENIPIWFFSFPYHRPLNFQHHESRSTIYKLESKRPLAYPTISLLRGPVKSKETLSRNRHAQIYYH